MLPFHFDFLIFGTSAVVDVKISQKISFLNELNWIRSRSFRHIFATRNAIFIIQYLFLPITKRVSCSSFPSRLYILFYSLCISNEKCNNFSSLTTQIYLKLPAIKWTFKIILLAPWKKRHHHFHPPAKNMSGPLRRRKHNIKKNYKNKISPTSIWKINENGYAVVYYESHESGLTVSSKAAHNKD